MENKIILKNVCTHNLKGFDLEIPKNKIVTFTGVSGSGKSSLVFDTIYTEAQRQLIETFGSFARKNLPKLSRPPVDEIKNLSTAIVIDQKRLGKNLRSTVGTVTEILSYMRLLYSKIGTPHIPYDYHFSFNNPEGMCMECMGLGKKVTIDIDKLLDKEKSLNEGAIIHSDYKVGGWYFRHIVDCGLFDSDKKLKNYSKEELFNLLHADNIETKEKPGVKLIFKNYEGIVRRLERLSINKCEDKESSKNTKVSELLTYIKCPHCEGNRLNEKARSVYINNKSIADVSNMELTELDKFLSEIESPIAKPLIDKMRDIVNNLIHIGVGYLFLNRAVATLSGGESQRIKMAKQLGCDLTNMIYILDEPSTGLHSRDNKKLIDILKMLRDKGNSVFVVEHDPELIEASDYIVEVGEKAGVNGGNIVFTDSVEELKKGNTLTSKFMKAKVDKFDRKPWSKYYEILNATENNLKNVNVKIPKEVLTCITGVSGSGKSSLIHDVFLKENPDAIVIDQSAPAKSSRANPATYIGIFDLIRKEMSKATKVEASMFSFNSKGGCSNCKGMGYVSFEMGFMDDMKMLCDTCKGKRYKEEVLDVYYKGKNIYEILEMTALEALEFFDSKEIKKRLEALCEVGLDYIRIGQSFSTLSGGESQRIKIASELHKEGNVYVMDEPTTGLHMSDTDKFMKIIKKLVDRNNSVIIIEHNLDVIKHADWVIDLGVEGGSKGGDIIFEGIPEELINCDRSFTGKYLNEFLNNTDKEFVLENS